MRRAWLSLLLAFAIAFGGAVNAWAAQDCPFKSAPVASHDCCPPGAMKDMGGQTDKSDHGKKSGECKLGMACRASIAVTPELVPLQIVSQVVQEPSARPADAGEPEGLAFMFWRPPQAA